MADYRTVSVSFWNDDYIEELSASERLFFIYLFTNPHINNAGVLKITPRKMAFETGIDDVQSYIERLKTDGKLVEIEGYFWVTGFIKHQTANSPKIAASIIKILEKIPEQLSFKIRERYTHIEEHYLKAIKTLRDPNKTLLKAEQYPTDMVSIPNQNPNDTLSIGPVEPEPESKPESEVKKKGESAPIMNPGFSDDFMATVWSFFAKNKKGSYKNTVTQGVALRQLFELSVNEHEARQALRETLTNSYQGFTWFFDRKKERMVKNGTAHTNGGLTKADHFAATEKWLNDTIAREQDEAGIQVCKGDQRLTANEGKMLYGNFGQVLESGCS